MDEKKIEISGEENKIKIEEGEKIEIKGDENVIKIQDAQEIEVKGDENVIEIEEKKPIKEGFKDIKKLPEKIIGFFQTKKNLNILLIILLILIIILSTWIRLQNLPLLVDSKTGKNIPLALDPFYFLRIAETMLDGGLTPVDPMRYGGLNPGFTHEITSLSVVVIYKIANLFNSNISIQFADIISPVIFFILGLITFFFLIFVLTKSKIVAFISTGFLAIIPMYLYRTLAGFSDHEAIGMFSFFLILTIYTLSINFLKSKTKESEKKKSSLVKVILFGLATAFFTAFNYASWGGIATFTLIIIPLSFLLIWLFKERSLQENKKGVLFNYLLFYIIWVIGSIIFSTIYGYNMMSFINLFTSGTSIVVGITLLFLIVDYFLIINQEKYLKGRLKKYRVLFSGLIMLILGSIILLLINKNLLVILSGLVSRLLDPFGEGRVGSTVAENAQPYLLNWMGQIGKFFFWLFYLGMVFIGFEISKGVKKKKHKIYFSLSWILLLSGVLFSRISQNSLLNGFNLISRVFYFTSILIFVVYFIWLYFNKEIKIKEELSIIMLWLFFMLVAARGAVRFFFLMTPFICFMVAYSSVKLFEYTKKTKDELLKVLLIIGFVLIIIALISSVFSFVKASSQQAKYTGPSANLQWQKAMKWVRENTPENSVFVHWWDYGYWVQYLGQRPTVTDGGHFNSFWDHLIGRYVLTTPYPETALSFMKAHDVSYLLIDPTDIGKYPAYSKIGSDKHTQDRYSMIPTFVANPSQTQETSEKEIRVFSGGNAGFVDKDIIYNKSGKNIFLPSQKAIIGGIILELEKDTNSFTKVEGVFFYNNEQFRIPLRYIYYDNSLIDLKEGLEAVVYFIPSISSNNQGISLNKIGAAIYLSPKVMPSLVSQLYLLDNVFEKYKGVTEVRSQESLVVDSLNSQGANLSSFVYYNGNLQGPIKIWEINVPENIIAREEFLRPSGEYAEFDNLTFTR